MAVKSVQVLHLGGPTVVRKDGVTWMVDQGKMIEVIHLSLLIRADEGNILVDAGMHPEDAVYFAKLAGKEVKWREEDLLPQQLQKVGLSMKDINMLVLSHLHVDHIGWLLELPNAEVVVQEMEHTYALRPPYVDYLQFPARYRFDNVKWKIVDGDTTLLPGLTLLFTPGHTIGHQSVMINLPKTGTVILAADAANLQENLDKELIPTPWSSARDAQLSIRKLKALAAATNALLIPGHDIDFYRQKIKKAPEAYT